MLFQKKLKKKANKAHLILAKASCAVLLLVSSCGALAEGWSGYVAAEYRLFTQAPLDAGQQNTSNLSFSVQPEFYRSWNNGDDAVLFTPFVRWDEKDANRSHFDIRELMWVHVADEWELQLGIGKVFWGVTESQHLVDVINQSDFVENLDGEDKLGQPMVNLTLIRDWGVVDLFVLPGFRERTFASDSGRFRSIPAIDDRSEYESAAEAKHVDFAFRWAQTFDDWDVGVSHFYGTSREPRIVPTVVQGELKLIPFYDLIHQTAVDVQVTMEEWLWKFELIHRSGQGETFNALTGGFEYTFVGVMETSIDIGVIAEYLYDDRDASTLVAFENDLFLGSRFAFNDAASSEFLFGVISDIETNARFYSLEASRRFADSWVISLEGRFVSGVSINEPLGSINRDDMIQLELARHF